MADNETFEEKLTRLENIVQTLEQGDVPLEKALTEFQKGIQLSKDLRKTLTESEELLSTMIDDQGNEVVDESKD